VRRADITKALAQDVYVNAYDHLADVRAGVASWAWLGTIARNLAPARTCGTRRRAWAVRLSRSPGA